mgnify:CR=1 FL=1
MKYSVLMIDIVNSKKLSNVDREDIQIFIKKSLNVLNEIFKPSLVFDVVFSAGDEVQGLFKNPVAPFLYFRLLRMIIDPVKIRCGIGIGDWEVKIKDGMSTEQDGSAYHLAREAIEVAHKKSEINIIFKSNTKNDYYINSLISATYEFAQKQTNQQRLVSLLIELFSPLYLERDMSLDDFGKFIFLLKNRDSIDYFKLNSFTLDSSKFENISEEYNPIDILEKLNNSESIYDKPTMIKGISFKVSDILETSRQNIEKSIKSSNVEILRNLDLTALMFIYDNYRG